MGTARVLYEPSDPGAGAVAFLVFAAGVCLLVGTIGGTVGGLLVGKRNGVVWGAILAIAVTWMLFMVFVVPYLNLM